MSISKQRTLAIVFKAAQEYQENLCDNNLMFVYIDKHKRLFSYQVEFNASNFMHLTGLKVNNEITALDFYHRCLDKRLSQRDFEFAKDGTTSMKLEVLPLLMKKNLSANAIGDFNSLTVKLYTEKVAGGVKGCMGFIRDGAINKNIPNTALKEDIRNCASVRNRIIATYRKRKRDSDYSEIVYKAKKIDWETLIFPEEIPCLIKPDISVDKQL